MFLRLGLGNQDVFINEVIVDVIVLAIRGYSGVRRLV